MKTYQSEPDASARDKPVSAASLADASGFVGKFLSAARLSCISSLRCNPRSLKHKLSEKLRNVKIGGGMFNFCPGEPMGM